MAASEWKCEAWLEITWHMLPADVGAYAGPPLRNQGKRIYALCCVGYYGVL